MKRLYRNTGILLLMLFFSTFTEQLSAQNRNRQSFYAETYNVPPSVPEMMVFAGDTIRFDRADLRERMDRELIAFSYMHTNSHLVIKRANRLFPVIEPILKENGIPDDLKYLMVIESNLDPKSLSSAGAAGLWQFMQATGRSYGLEVNANIDERYNIRKSTVAACKYLAEAYEKYGNWMTVAASYNGGQNGISRRLEEQHQTNALDLWLVEETSRYMFRLMAVKMLFENPRRFGFTFTVEDLYPYIPPKKEVVVTDPVEDLVKFAEEHGVTYAQLKRANLWLRESKLNNSSHRTYIVEIPDTQAEYYDPSKTKVHNEAWIK
ncbi:MAG: lytic transglycosylase domain-containing protein [Bacteroidaceae bacterium]|nr:lytic transglycosylase domain-containing protein [Bacteroidaceae bacterium]